MTEIPLFRMATENERERIFDKQIAEAHRRSEVSVEMLRQRVASHQIWLKAAFGAFWRGRHKPLHLRSSDWPEPRRSEVAAEWDAYDREQNAQVRLQARRDAKEAVDALRWSRWALSRFNDPNVAAEIELGPSYEYLHWSNRTRSESMGFQVREPAVLNNRGRVVAEVICRRGIVHGHTMEAIIYSPTDNMRPVSTCHFRQRKQAVAWLTDQLHRRASALFGKEIDLPEWSKT